MKTRIFLLLLLTALLLLSAGAVTGSAPPRYRIKTEALPGDAVPLTSVGVLAGATSAGGAYRLVTDSVSASKAGGCCCSWLPCVLNKY